MKHITPMIAAAAALGLLAGCAEDYGYHGPPGPYYGPPVAAGYGGFYDDYYGPYYDGYWGDDGFFYYRRGDRDDFRRDNDRHFRREGSPGFHPVRVHPQPPAHERPHHPE